MEHNTAGAGSFQRRRAGSMRQTAYKKGGKARRAAGGAKAGPEEGVTLPADEAARMQCAPGLREEWGRGPEKTPPEENGRLEKETGAALPAGQRKGRAEMSGKARRAAGDGRRPRRQARPFLRMRRRARVRMRGARRVQQCAFGRRVRAACGTAGPNRRTPYFARHAAARWHRGAFCTSAAARAHALAARMMWTSTRPFCPRARCAGAFCSGTERPKRRFIRRTGVTLCWAAGAVWLHVGPGRCAENEKEAGVC